MIPPPDQVDDIIQGEYNMSQFPKLVSGCLHEMSILSLKQFSNNLTGYM